MRPWETLRGAAYSCRQNRSESEAYGPPKRLTAHRNPPGLQNGSLAERFLGRRCIKRPYSRLPRGSYSVVPARCVRPRSGTWRGRSNSNEPYGHLPSNAVFCRALAISYNWFTKRTEPSANQENALGELTRGTQPLEKPPENRLDSWKEIAAYLGRDVTTVQRWEKREGMPVHRHLHDKRGSVYAVSAELDAWLASRRLQSASDEEADASGLNSPAASAATQTTAVRWSVSPVRFWIALTSVAVIAILAVAYAMSRGRTDRASAPKIKSLAVLPLKNMSGDPGQDYL